MEIVITEASKPKKREQSREDGTRNKRELTAESQWLTASKGMSE